MSNATAVESLKRSRDNVVAVVEAQTLAWVAAGCPPTFSVDGESYQWGQWLKDKNEELKGLTESIALLSSPWIVRSQGRV